MGLQQGEEERKEKARWGLHGTSCPVVCPKPTKRCHILPVFLGEDPLSYVLTSALPHAWVSHPISDEYGWS